MDNLLTFRREIAPPPSIVAIRVPNPARHQDFPDLAFRTLSRNPPSGKGRGDQRPPVCQEQRRQPRSLLQVPRAKRYIAPTLRANRARAGPPDILPSPPVRRG